MPPGRALGAATNSFVTSWVKGSSVLPPSGEARSKRVPVATTIESSVTHVAPKYRCVWNILTGGVPSMRARITLPSGDATPIDLPSTEKNGFTFGDGFNTSVPASSRGSSESSSRT